MAGGYSRATHAARQRGLAPAGGGSPGYTYYGQRKRGRYEYGQRGVSPAGGGAFGEALPRAPATLYP